MSKGVLVKMATTFASPVQYVLELGNESINMNALLNKEITIQFEGYECLNCGSTKKTYRMGYCYNCFYQIPQAADWIIRPELSKAHLGIEDRNLTFEQEMQLQPHWVYLALSSEVKVGVTRKSQAPTRWIDQGANQALPIIEVPNRYLAGIAEVALKKKISDKTNWRKMLTNEVCNSSLIETKNSLLAYLPAEVHDYKITDNLAVLQLEYPVIKFPSKVVSLNLMNTPSFSGTLIGIKGQYLMFEDNTVFNIRSNEGSVITFHAK